MKILLVAPGSDFSTSVERALIQEGHAVIRVDERLDPALPSFLRRLRPLWRIGRRIPWWRRRSNRMLQKYLLHIGTKERPDVMLSTKGMNIRPMTLQALKALGIRTVCWFPDNAANEPYASWVRTIGPEWDHFFSFDSAIYEQVPADIHDRVHVLPFGVDPEAWDPEPITDADRQRYACDVCFVGAPYLDRIALLSRIIDVNLKIFGWSGWEHTRLAKYYHGPLDAREASKAYRLAKICVNTNILPHARGVNLKTFEITAAGGFQLTDELADLSGSFTIGSELDTFVDESDFERKVRYWLGRDEERQRISCAGQERCVRNHALRARMRTLMTFL